MSCTVAWCDIGPSVLSVAACPMQANSPVNEKTNPPVPRDDLPLSFIMAPRRNVALEAERMRRGDWPCTLSHRLRGSTLGIFGLGAIGRLVAAAGHGLGMKVLVWGQRGSTERATAAGYEVAAGKEDLFARSDVLSLHVRLKPDTIGILCPAHPAPTT